MLILLLIIFGSDDALGLMSRRPLSFAYANSDGYPNDFHSSSLIGFDDDDDVDDDDDDNDNNDDDDNDESDVACDKAGGGGG